MLVLMIDGEKRSFDKMELAGLQEADYQFCPTFASWQHNSGPGYH